MRDASGRAVIRLGDPTDHQGEVKTAFNGLTVRGVPVSGEDCMAWCPKCNGEFRLIPSGPRRHMGKAIAYEGDLTECGAKLISTLKG